MSSKQVTDRQKSAKTVSDAASTFGERLRVGMEAALAAGAQPGTPPPDANALAEAAARTLDASIAALVTADEAHAFELGDDGGLLATRDERSAALHAHLVVLRAGLLGLYGEAATVSVGFVGRTARDPVVVAREAREVAQGLTGRTLPEPMFEGATIDVAAQAAALVAEAQALEEAVEAVTTDHREDQVTLTARDAAMVSHDEVFSRVADLLSSLFAMAGEPDLAARVRPSRQRPGRLLSEEAELVP